MRSMVDYQKSERHLCLSGLAATSARHHRPNEQRALSYTLLDTAKNMTDGARTEHTVRHYVKQCIMGVESAHESLTVSSSVFNKKRIARRLSSCCRTRLMHSTARDLSLL